MKKALSIIMCLVVGMSLMVPVSADKLTDVQNQKNSVDKKINNIRKEKKNEEKKLNSIKEQKQEIESVQKREKQEEKEWRSQIEELRHGI